MQQSDYQFHQPSSWMQKKKKKKKIVSMHKRPTSFRHSHYHAKIEHWSKDDERETRKTEADGMIASPTKQNLSEELIQGLAVQLRLTMLGRNA